jgi:hypothetical protein
MKMDKGCSLLLLHIDPLLEKTSKQATTAVAMQRHDKHTSTKIELLLETVFSTQSVLRSYIEDKERSK